MPDANPKCHFLTHTSREHFVAEKYSRDTAGMISAVYILHRPDETLPFLRNDLLVYRSYHNDVPPFTAVLENFCVNYGHQPLHERSPFMLVKGINHSYIIRDFDIMILAISKSNSNAMLTVLFLNNFFHLLEQYLATTSSGPTVVDHLIGKTDKSEKEFKLDRDRICDNSNIIHELLDECVDFGVIQSTDFNILKEYIKVEVNFSKEERKVHGIDFDNDNDSESESENDSKKSKRKSMSLSNIQVWRSGSSKSKKGNKKKNVDKIRSTHNQAVRAEEQNSFINQSILRTSSLAINWRPKGIFYAKNEIYIDLIEECDFYYDLGADIIKRNEIFGRCEVKCYLSGMPVCKVQFNEKHISGIEEGEDYANANIDEETGNILPNISDNEDDEEPTEDKQSLLDASDHESDNTAKSGKHIPIRNIQFHQCVELSSIYQKNIVNFTPPDDKFTLLTYDVEQQRQVRKLPLIKLSPIYKIIQETKTLQIMCTLSTQFKKRMKTQDLTIKIPIDPKLFPLVDTDVNLKYKAQMGEVSFKIDSSQLLWQIEEVKGNTKDIKMMAELKLISNPLGKDIDYMINRKVEAEDPKSATSASTIESINDNEIEQLDNYYGVNKNKESNENQSIQNKFESIAKRSAQKHFDNDIYVTFCIPQLSYSGLKLIYLRVDEMQMKYTSFPWVRYKTETGYGNLNSAYRFKLGLNNFILV